MKITLLKVVTTTVISPTGNKVGASGLSTTPKWQFVEHPEIYLCAAVEKVLGLSNVAIGTKLELNIDKFCITPPEGAK